MAQAFADPGGRDPTTQRRSTPPAVGRVSVGQPRPPVPHQLAGLQHSVGNRAVAALVGRRPPEMQWAPEAGPPVPTLNPYDAAHRLVEAIDQKEVKPPFKGRHVDLPTVVSVLSGRTTAELQMIDEAYARSVHRRLDAHPLREDLLGGGESHFPTDLTAAEQARVRSLLAGTRAAPGADDTLTARHRLNAAAAELHTLLHGDLPAAGVDRIMALLRRPAADNQALATQYRAQHGSELRLDLGALGPTRMVRATLLLSGLTQPADQMAVAAERGRIAAIDAKLEKVRGVPPVGPVQDEVDDLRKQRRAAVAQIESRVAEAGAVMPDQDGPGGGQAARTKRMKAVLDAGAGSAVVAGADAAALQAVVDSDPAARAGARLVQLREAGELTADAVSQALRGLGEQAEEQVRQELPAADAAARERAVRLRTTGWMSKVAAVYDTARPPDAPSFHRMLAGTGGRLDVLRNQALFFGGGRIDEEAELRFALAGDRKDLDTVKRVLQGKNADEIKQRFPWLEMKLFGAVGQDRDAEEIAGLVVPTAGKATGADRLALEDQLQRPTKEGGLDEALYLRTRAEREYAYAISHRGFTGWWRDLSDNEARALLNESIGHIRHLFTRFVASGMKDTGALAQMRLWRATIRGDRAGYEKANAELRATFEALADFALQAALTALLTPAAAWLFRGAEAAAATARAAKYVRGLLVNTVTTVASHAALQDGYGLDGLKRDLLGTLTGALGSAGATKLFGVFGRPFIESVAGKEIISIASTAAAIQANALVEGHALTGDQWVQNLLLGHGQGKVQHHMGEWSEKTYGPPAATSPTATAAAPEQPSVHADDVHKQLDVSDVEAATAGSGRTSTAPSEPVPASVEPPGRTEPARGTTASEGDAASGTRPRSLGGGPVGAGLGGPAPEGSRPSRPHDSGDVVEIRFDYAEERYDPTTHGTHGTPPFRSPYPVNVVPTRSYQGRAAYDAVRVVEGDVAYKELTVRLHLRAGPGVSEGADLPRMRDDIRTGVEGIYNDPRHRLVDGDILRVRVEFVEENAAHATIDVERAAPGTIGRADQYMWFVGSDPIIYAHEVGHHLGLIDEYVERGYEAPQGATSGNAPSSREPFPSTSRDRPDAPGVRHDRSFMGGIAEAPAYLTPLERFAWELHGLADPGSRMHTRHLVDITDAIAEQRLRNALVGRGVNLTSRAPDTASLRSTDLDAVGPQGELRITPSNVSESGMVILEDRLVMLRYQAAQRGVEAQAIFDVDTPHAVLRMARHILGDFNVTVR